MTKKNRSDKPRDRHTVAYKYKIPNSLSKFVCHTTTTTMATRARQETVQLFVRIRYAQRISFTDISFTVLRFLGLLTWMKKERKNRISRVDFGSMLNKCLCRFVVRFGKIRIGFFWCQFGFSSVSHWFTAFFGSVFCSFVRLSFFASFFFFTLNIQWTEEQPKKKKKENTKKKQEESHTVWKFSAF